MNNLLMITMSVMVLINIIFFVAFERKKPGPKEILPIVVVCCGASLGRVIFAVIPQVQPVTVLVIIAGSVYGCRTGYVTGALCALVSNLFLGQGPWTIFQMAAWGIIGLFAGILGKILVNRTEHMQTICYALYSFFAAFLFSILTDTLTVSYLGETVKMWSAVAVYATGIAFNVSHAVGNVLMMIFLFPVLSRKLMRVRKKNS